MHDAIIVGGGLFGQVIADALSRDGQDVLVLDKPNRLAGSKPAACLMKPSWFSSMGKDIYEPALEQLSSQYKVQTITFEVGIKSLKTDVFWINPKEILHGPTKNERVVQVDAGVVFTDLHQYTARTVIVAAGYWTEKLLPQYKQVGQQGAAFLWDESIKQPFIKPWAPYRQLVAFNRGDGCWVGDGTAIKEQNWTMERLVTSMNRCQEAVGRYMGTGGDGPQVLVGIRPYAKGHKPCLLEEVKPGLWVASGGAKNGTMAAGYCAHVIRERTS